MTNIEYCNKNSCWFHLTLPYLVIFLRTGGVVWSGSQAGIFDQMHAQLRLYDQGHMWGCMISGAQVKLFDVYKSLQIKIPNVMQHTGIWDNYVSLLFWTPHPLWHMLRKKLTWGLCALIFPPEVEMTHHNVISPLFIQLKELSHEIELLVVLMDWALFWRWPLIVFFIYLLLLVSTLGFTFFRGVAQKVARSTIDVSASMLIDVTRTATS